MLSRTASSTAFSIGKSVEKGGLVKSLPVVTVLSIFVLLRSRSGFLVGRHGDEFTFRIAAAVAAERRQLVADGRLLRVAPAALRAGHRSAAGHAGHEGSRKKADGKSCGGSPGDFLAFFLALKGTTERKQVLPRQKPRPGGLFSVCRQEPVPPGRMPDSKSVLKESRRKAER